MQHAVDIRPLTSIAELKACEEIERVVWGIEDFEAMPAAHMMAAIHAGGLAAGAFAGDMLVGFVYGFVAHHPKDDIAPFGFHSHLMAVLAPYRQAGVGRKLKWFQREWCLERGYPWVTWTFDPLQARNARLNLEHLGAVVREYQPDVYGRLGGSLNGELPTDRFLATWDLADPRVAQLAAGGHEAPKAIGKLPYALRVGEDGLPLEPTAAADGDKLLVQIPADFADMVAGAPDRALAWRLALRGVFGRYLTGGYEIRRFLDNSYLLEKPPKTKRM